MAEPVLGIDFGTSFCRVAVAESRGNRVVPRLLSVSQVPAVFPSVAGVDPLGTWLAGDDACRFAAVEPGWAVHGAKRLLGRGEGKGDAGCPDLVRSDWGGPKCETGSDGSVLLRLPTGDDDADSDDIRVSPLRVVSEILRLARENARQALGLPVVRCVIGVPAVFGPGEREMIARTAGVAGLDVLALIDEGLAVTLAHCGSAKGKRRDDGPLHYLAVDVGGGFTSVTLVRRDGCRYRELAATGFRLGGEDIQHLLAGRLLEEYGRMPGWPTQAGGLLGHVRRMAGAALSRLSAEESLPAVVFHDGRTFASLLSRSQVDRLGEDIARRLREVVPALWLDSEPATTAAGQAARLPVILPAGGLGRAPFVQRALKTALPDAEVAAPMPAESVALGAALWGWTLVSGDEGADEATGVLRTASVAPWTIAVGRSAGEPAVLVRAGSSLPCRAVCEWKTLAEPREPRAVLRLFEAHGSGGDAPAAEAAFNPIGEIRLEIPGSEKGAAASSPGAHGAGASSIRSEGATGEFSDEDSAGAAGDQAPGTWMRLVLTVAPDGRLRVAATDAGSGRPIRADLRFYGLADEDWEFLPQAGRGRGRSA
jgi:molecular chaperone DnaK (HSP70)